jgi:FkbM family methyltransferase
MSSHVKKSASYWWKGMKFNIRRFLWDRQFPRGRGVLVETDYGMMICSPTDSGVGRQLLKWGHYNPEEVGNLIQLVDSDSRVLVVGGHVGALVVPIAKKVGSVVVVEASPANFEFLQCNVAINGLRNVELRHFAAMESFGQLGFLCSGDNSGGSKVMPRVKTNEFVYDAPQHIMVACAALDDEVDGEFDLIVMDIEGAEFHAMLGAKSHLRRAQIFVVEFIPNHLEKVAQVSIESFAELLISFDFQLVTFPRLKLTGDPRDILLSGLEQVAEMGGYEDGLIFSRSRAPGGVP